MLKKSKCKIPDCNSEIMYVKQKVCQKHYFRFMRKGYYELETPKETIDHSDGYILRRCIGHPLSQKCGYIYEHRFVYYSQVSQEVSSCVMCKKEVTWENVHIDHIDENRKNNSPENLRSLCNGCNTHRDKDFTQMGKLITYDGITQNATAWAKDSRVNIPSTCIRQRKRRGMTDFDTLFSEKKTHKK